MNVFNCFSFDKEKFFAAQLTAQLAQELPPTLMQKRSKLLTVNKITRLLERTYQSARTYQTTERMGFIRRAVLANNLKWSLRNKGYPDDFVDVAIEGLIVELSRALRKV